MSTKELYIFDNKSLTNLLHKYKEQIIDALQEEDKDKIISVIKIIPDIEKYK